jgi:hypothetical protein
VIKKTTRRRKNIQTVGVTHTQVQAWSTLIARTSREKRSREEKAIEERVIPYNEVLSLVQTWTVIIQHSTFLMITGQP